MTKKIVKIVGGLGNQMFQYAFAYALSKKLNTQTKLDLSWFEEVKTDQNVTARPFDLHVFNIDYEVAIKEELAEIIRTVKRSKVQRFLHNVFKIKQYRPIGNCFVEMVMGEFNKKLFSSPDYFYYDGYFQNEKYFKDAREELLKAFSLNLPVDEQNQGVLDEILKTDSVSLHVRRGDYVTLECAKDFHGTCSIEYYQKAIEYIAKKVKNPHFFLFSDDIPWVAENLKLEYPCTIVDFNQDKSWMDLELMKNCKHNIIANSSFSWWGAWLNQNPPKIVVAPRQWTAKKVKKCGIIPPEWIKL
ncbi:MAG: alpha-1,2-fucosyltransferase [bacterium]